MRRTTLWTIGSMFVVSHAATGGVFGTEVISDQLVTLDPGALTGSPVGAYSDGSYSLQGLAGNASTGELYGLSAGTGRLYTVGAATGVSSAITGSLYGGNANGLTYDANRGVLWVSANSGQVWTYDLDTGVSNAVGTAPMGALEGLAFDAATDTLYALSDSDDRIYTMDTGTLAMTALTGGLDGGNWRGLTFDATTGSLVATRVGIDGYLVEVDPSNGQVVNAGSWSGAGGFIQGLAYIPSPGVFSVLAIGGVAAMRRR